MSAIEPAMVAAVEHYLSRCVRHANGCITLPDAPYRYGEVRWGDRRMTAHRAVLAVALDRMPHEDEVAKHACDNKPCVNVEHLSFGTQASNLHECYDRQRRSPGTWQKGEQRPGAVLTAGDVREMRRQSRAGASLSEVAAMAGVSYSSARMAVRGETWQHLTDEPPVAGRRNKVGNARAYRLARAEEARRVRSLADQGYSLAEIATQLDVTRHTAWRLLQAAREVAA